MCCAAHTPVEHSCTCNSWGAGARSPRERDSCNLPSYLHDRHDGTVGLLCTCTQVKSSHPLPLSASPGAAPFRRGVQRSDQHSASVSKHFLKWHETNPGSSWKWTPSQAGGSFHYTHHRGASNRSGTLRGEHICLRFDRCPILATVSNVFQSLLPQQVAHLSVHNAGHRRHLPRHRRRSTSHHPHYGR
jgi:hypothetical protein